MTSRELAINIWPVLIEVSRNRAVITYKDLAVRISHRSSQIGDELEVLLRFCDAKGYPPLTMLVVNQTTYLPSWDRSWGEWDDFMKSMPRYAKKQLSVHQFEWGNKTSEFLRTSMKLALEIGRLTSSPTSPRREARRDRMAHPPKVEGWSKSAKREIDRHLDKVFKVYENNVISTIKDMQAKIKKTKKKR
jgi:5-methylcytosine-specific restriction endonuclease McrA